MNNNLKALEAKIDQLLHRLKRGKLWRGGFGMQEGSMDSAPRW